MWAITGASGFIGGALLRSLDADATPVRTLSRRPLDRPGHLAADVRDEAALHELVRGASVVVHLAGWVHRATRTAAERHQCFAVNVDATRELVEAIAAQPKPPFLIYVSSANVYAPSDDAIDESAPLAPQSVYGQSKLQAERLVLAAPIRAAVLRPATVFGEGAPGNLQRLIGMVRRRVVVQIGGGRQRKTILPVENLVAAIRAIAREQPAGEIFNGGGPALTMREIVDEIASALGVRALRVPVPRAAARTAARMADAVARLVAPRAASVAALLDTYSTNVIISDGKLRARTGYAPPVTDVRAALRASIH
jgi:nucleoside-diphosphate-sugar epimerase